MVIGVFGESCTGKTTLAEALRDRLQGEIVTGRDYLRGAKSEDEARRVFRKRLEAAVAEGCVIYVISEREQLALLPDGALRVLVTAELETIKERFAARMHGSLPAPVAAMLEKKHGCFDREPHDIHVISGQTGLEEACGQIAARAGA